MTFLPKPHSAQAPMKHELINIQRKVKMGTAAVTVFIFEVEMLQCPGGIQNSPHKWQKSMGKPQKAIILASELV